MGLRVKLLLMALFFPLLMVQIHSAGAAEVAQGKCKDYDLAGRRLILEVYDTEISPAQPYGKSTGAFSAYDLANAKIGIPPEPGDILRIAYTVEGGVLRAIKVMNVSKQDLRKK